MISFFNPKQASEVNDQEVAAPSDPFEGPP